MTFSPHLALQVPPRLQHVLNASHRPALEALLDGATLLGSGLHVGNRRGAALRRGYVGTPLAALRRRLAACRWGVGRLADLLCPACAFRLAALVRRFVRSATGASWDVDHGSHHHGTTGGAGAGEASSGHGVQRRGSVHHHHHHHHHHHGVHGRGGADELRLLGGGREQRLFCQLSPDLTLLRFVALRPAADSFVDELCGACDPLHLLLPSRSAPQDGQSRRVGGATAGHQQLVRLHLKAWGCPPHW